MLEKSTHILASSKSLIKWSPSWIFLWCLSNISSKKFSTIVSLSALVSALNWLLTSGYLFPKFLLSLINYIWPFFKLQPHNFPTLLSRVLAWLCFLLITLEPSCRQISLDFTYSSPSSSKLIFWWIISHVSLEEVCLLESRGSWSFQFYHECGLL